MKANKIAADLQTATMLTVIGGSTFDLLRDLLSPEDPADKSYAELKQALSAHLSPKPLVIGERYRFYQRDQRQSESIAAYVAELRRLSRTCAFGDHLKEALRDRFVCRLRSAATRRKLLATSGLDFDKAVTNAKADELAARDADEVSGSADGAKQRALVGIDGSAAVHSVHPRANQRGRSLPAKPQGTTSQPCFRCGGLSHSPDKCRFLDAECDGCHKRGHIRPFCRSEQRAPSSDWRPVPKPRGQRASVHQVGQPSSAVPSESLFASDEEPIHHVRVDRVHSAPPAPIAVTTVIDTVRVDVEVDTGAAVSLLPSALYEKHFASRPLQPTNLMLTAYNGESL